LIQSLEEDLIIEMNIGEDVAMRNFQCCGAANHISHGSGKKRLTVLQSCLIDRRKPPASGPVAKKAAQMPGF
jgi:hypothetical protein